MSPPRLSRRGLLAGGVGALAGGQLLRPARFRGSYDADPSVSTDEWLLPGRSPARRNHVPVAGGTQFTEEWSVEFDNESGYSLVVVDGTVVCPVEDDGLHALSVSDGERRWRYRPPTEFDGGVAAAGRYLCCPTRSAFHRLGLDGAEAWQLPGYRRRTVLTALIYSRSYLPVGTTLFVTGDRGLEARDLASGLRYWTSADVGEGAYGAPIAFADGTVYCSDSDFQTVRFSAFDASEGESLWTTNEYEYRARDGAVVEDTLLAVGGTDRDGRIQALSTDDGSLRWEREAGDALYDIAVADGVVLCSGLHDRVHAFDLATGESRWREGFDDEMRGTVLTDDHCYVHRSTGVEVRDPATGDRLAMHELDGGEARELAYAGGKLFALQATELAVLEVTDDA